MMVILLVFQSYVFTFAFLSTEQLRMPHKLHCSGQNHLAPWSKYHSPDITCSLSVLYISTSLSHQIWAIPECDLQAGSSLWRRRRRQIKEQSRSCFLEGDSGWIISVTTTLHPLCLLDLLLHTLSVISSSMNPWGSFPGGKQKREFRWTNYRLNTMAILWPS